MKNFVFKFAMFFKRFGVLFRLIGIVVLGIIVFNSLIPDIMFHAGGGQIESHSYAQIMEKAKSGLPKYAIVSDSLMTTDNYVESRKDDDLEDVYFGVLLTEDSLSKEIALVVKDDQPDAEGINSGLYFYTIVYSLNGRLSANDLDTDVYTEFKNMGYTFADDVVVLKLHKEPMGLAMSIVALLIIIFLMITVAFSFMPADKLSDVEIVDIP